MRSDKYIDSYLASFSRLGDSNGIFKGLSSLPTMAEIKALEDSLLNLLYPGRSLSCPKDSLETAVVFEMEYFMSLLDKTVYYAFKSDEMYRTQPDDLVHRRTDEVVDSLMGELGKIRTLLKKDAQAGPQQAAKYFFHGENSPFFSQSDRSYCSALSPFPQGGVSRHESLFPHIWLCRARLSFRRAAEKGGMRK